MKNLLTFFQKNDRFAGHSGIELLEISEGRAKAAMNIKKHHLNSVGSVHGGAIFTLADFVFAVASNSHGTVAVAINVSISYMKAATRGRLFAEAIEVAINPKLASYTVNVTDEQGGLIAIFQGMVYRKKETVSI
ncbi:MAG: hotdog fold thioesterase [Desulfobacteraceae bacterium]|nr:MAG: hotdog fold thioesterase [Desulfobacteraceae bacterium]